MVRRLVASSLVLAIAGPCPVPVSAADRGFELHKMTLGEASDAQAAGIGCAWSLPGERGMRFAAADDHAAVKIDGTVMRLRPAAGAKDLFPFTYGSWVGEGVSVSIKMERRRKVRERYLVAGTASLTVVVRGAMRRFRGRMECGR